MTPQEQIAQLKKTREAIVASTSIPLGTTRPSPQIARIDAEIAKLDAQL